MSYRRAYAQYPQFVGWLTFIGMILGWLIMRFIC